MQSDNENQARKSVRRVELLEEALAEYVERFGLSEKARAVFNMPRENGGE